MTLLRARNSLDDVAGERRMHVAKGADAPPVLTPADEYMHRFRFRDRFLDTDRRAGLVDRLKVAPIHREMLRSLAREDSVGLGARRDEDSASGQGAFPGVRSKHD